MGYVSFRGVSTQSLPNVYVQMMPSHKKARKRMAEYYVKGRDGALHNDEGFENMDITIRLVMVNAPAETRQIINAWADGTGKLVSSDDLSRCWKATVIDEIDYERVEAVTIAPPNFSTSKAYYIGDYVTYAGMVYKFIQNHSAGNWNSNQVKAQPWKIDGLYDTAEITFNCAPHMYESTDSTIEMTAGQGTQDPGGSEVFSIINPGTDTAYPLIKVQGTDTEAIAFDFCGEYIIIRGIDSSDPIIIDCENGYIYSESGQAKSMEGNIPKIPLGASAVYFNPEHSPTKLIVTPHWRWV